MYEYIEIYIDKLQMQAINKECISLTSDNLTDAEMLTHILNQCKKKPGNSASLLDPSETIGSQDKTKTLADNAEEIFGYYSENDESIINDHAGRQTIMPSSNFPSNIGTY